jgi:hypothetical protein
MARILLQTTIPAHPDDWDITRFSLLADELRAAGFEVIARNRANRGDDDPVLSHVDELGYDQLWLMAVDVGDGLTAADAYAIERFREHGGGVLTARDHEDLGCCLSRLGHWASSTNSTTRTSTLPRCATTRTPRPSRGPTITRARTATISRYS